MEHIAYLNALNYTALTPQQIFCLIKKRNYSPKAIWQASYLELKTNGLDNKIIEKFIEEKKHIDPKHEMERLQKQKLSIAIHPELNKDKSDKIESITTTTYPHLLSHIPVPPPLLYIKGRLEDSKTTIRVAVVGSRMVTNYGKYITENIAYALAQYNIVIVSGLALGVDTIAHKAALKAKAPTIAVLGSGLDIIYPPSNTNLAEKIIDANGAVISEFPLGSPPLKYHFPQRNRIIAGLSHGVLVTEAAIKSGSLITAAHALEQNREVFAVPGNINQKSTEGTNNLIKRGAKLITRSEEILEDLPIPKEREPQKKAPIILTSNIEKTIYEQLSQEPMLVDTIIKNINLPTSEVHTALTLMEIKGIIKSMGGGWYAI